jgi:formylglycine-generating enzyme required for sulfatase activity
MGSQDGLDDERPLHKVSMAGFSMQRHEVTNEEFRRFDPAHEFPAGQQRHPVANVSWYQAAAYAAWLGASLPTEAEWEYAARGAGGRDYPWPEGSVDETRAVYASRSTEPVGSRPRGRTPDGLDDIAGNVWEWCRDWYGPYTGQTVQDPLGPTKGAGRVLRGGSFYSAARGLRTAGRVRDGPDDRGGYIGFRLVFSRLRP